MGLLRLERSVFGSGQQFLIGITQQLTICEMGSFIIPLIKYPQPLLQLEEMGILFFTEVFHLT